MRRLLRWTGYGLAVVLGLVLALVLGGFAASEVMIQRTWPKQPVRVAAAHDPGAVARGAQVARRLDCRRCHGAALTGRVFAGAAGRISAPNLTQLVRAQSDADLARAIRTGVAADGRSLWLMPSEKFASLSDADTADLIAYLRSLPPAPGVGVVHQIGLKGRIGVLTGRYKSAPQLIAEGRGRD